MAAPEILGFDMMPFPLLHEPPSRHVSVMHCPLVSPLFYFDGHPDAVELMVCAH